MLFICVGKYLKAARWVNVEVFEVLASVRGSDCHSHQVGILAGPNEGVHKLELFSQQAVALVTEWYVRVKSLLIL